MGRRAEAEAEATKAASALRHRLDAWSEALSDCALQDCIYGSLKLAYAHSSNTERDKPFVHYISDAGFPTQRGVGDNDRRHDRFNGPASPTGPIPS